MSDSTSLALQKIVERAVRPSTASTTRKKMMREELLGHVTGVFEEEFSRTEDEQQALILTEQRFGDPKALAGKLRESVPTTDRFIFSIERLIDPRIGESLLRRATRYAMTMFAVHAIPSVALCLLIFPLIGKTDQIGISTYLLVLVATATGGITFMATLLTNGLGRALFGRSGRSYYRAVLVGIASCFVPISLPLIVVIGMIPFAEGELIIDPPSLWRTLPATLLFPLTLIGAAKLVADEMRYREEWSGLEID